jgi:predicted transposase
MDQEVGKEMITLHCKLTFEDEKDRQTLIGLMRKFSSCYRYAFNRLLEGHTRENLKKQLQKVFNLNSRYCGDAVLKAQSLISACKERGKNPKKVVFDGRRLFEKLQKGHINGKERQKLKQKWKERRKRLLYSRGDKTKKGNLNTRIEFEKDKLIMRINAGDRKWMKAKVKRTVIRESDKWINFVANLLQANQTGEYFPYSVEIRRINNNFYAFISYEEKLLQKP